jgi:2',3'-cyclic-nucleotide 2'-phosphodiesterase (5'-nucleotidase family)
MALSEGVSGNRSLASALATAAVAVAGLTACVPGSAVEPMPTATPEPIEVTILHTNDNWGETKPCG